MEFPLAQFRILYPVFVAVLDDVVLAWSVQAECLLRDRECACEGTEWMLLTAHLMAVNGLAGGGSDAPTVGNIASASIDKVSVSFTAPPAGDDWSFWLGSTPYGKQFLALAARCRPAGGIYSGSLPERHAFRSVYGIFPGRGRFR